MTKPYLMTIKTPEGETVYESLCREDFIVFGLSHFSSMIKPLSPKPCGRQADLDGDIIPRLEAILRRERALKTNRVPLLARAGHDRELIRCYLKGLSVAQTVHWFKQNLRYRISKSQIGRYFVQYKNLGFGEYKQY